MPKIPAGQPLVIERRPRTEVLNDEEGGLCIEQTSLDDGSTATLNFGWADVPALIDLLQQALERRAGRL